LNKLKFDLKMTLWANIGNALGGLSAFLKVPQQQSSGISRNA
jgi:hypothetical protein